MFFWKKENKMIFFLCIWTSEKQILVFSSYVFLSAGIGGQKYNVRFQVELFASGSG